MMQSNSSQMILKALIVLMSLAVAAHAAPTSTTGGINAAVSICKVLAQKGCKGVGIRGDECCPNSGLWCNTNAPSTCSQCKTCVWGEKQVTPCGALTNTVCAACPNPANVVTYANPGKSCVVTECKTGFYYKSESEGCVACDTCVSGSNYQTTQCSTDSNRVCTTCSSCTDGSNYQTSSCNILANTVCTTCSSCGAGTYPNGGCVTTAAGGVDRICPDCPNNANAKTYANPGSDCVVEECMAGFYYKSEAEGCVACADPCVDGTSYKSTRCSTASNRVCSTCQECDSEAAGTYGTYTNGGCKTTESGGVDRICTACTKCVEGASYETTSCSASSNRVCTTCDSCTDGSTYETSACTVKSNRVCSTCSTCADGSTYESAACTITANTECTKCQTCEAGYHSNGGCAAKKDTICEIDAPMILTSNIPEEPIPEPKPVCNGGCSECTTCQWSNGVGSVGVCKAANEDKLCSSGAGFCAAGTCKVPVSCGAVPVKPGCNNMCAFDVTSEGTKGASYHCQYVKAASGSYAAGSYVCRNNSVCDKGNCSCDAGKGSRRMLQSI